MIAQREKKDTVYLLYRKWTHKGRVKMKIIPLKKGYQINDNLRSEEECEMSACIFVIDKKSIE